jgi:trigger factor
MKIAVKEAGGCRRVLEVSAPPEAVLDEYRQVLKAFTAAARIDGFRPGRAPAALIERRFAKPIEEEVKERLLPKVFAEAVQREGLKTAAIVDAFDVTFNKDKGLDFKIRLDVEPEFKLPKYQKISLTREPIDVSDQQVEEALTRVRLRDARFEDADGRVAQSGDLVQLDYEGVSDGKKVSEIASASAGLGEGKDFWAIVGEPEFLPGMAAGLVGVKAGECRDVQVSFPGDYSVEAVRGLSATYHVIAKAIRVRVLPDINAEFCGRFAAKDEVELRQRLRDELRDMALQRQTAQLKDEIAKRLLDDVKCDLPEALVARHTNATARNMAQRFVMQGVAREQIQERSAEIIEAAHRSSTDRVKLAYILERIADEEKITVGDEEVEAHVKAMAAARGVPEERVRAELNERNGWNGLRDGLREDKTMDLLVSRATGK